MEYYMVRNYMFFGHDKFGIWHCCFLLYKVYQLPPNQFQTAWFMESLATRIIVIFINRTPKISFAWNKASRFLFITVLLFLFIWWALPYFPSAKYIGFKSLPVEVSLFISLVVGIYQSCAEFIKRLITKKYLGPH